MGSRVRLDPAAVGASIGPLGRARMLPGAAYVDDGVLAWELEHLFGRDWLCAGRAGFVNKPGEQAAVAVGGTSVLLTRGTGGGLHVHANVCRHRAHELLRSGTRAHRGVVQCPYHAWSYELDGRLRVAPRFEGVESFEAAELGLVPVRHAEWGGWVFVDLSGEAGPFDDHLGDLATIAEPWTPERLVAGATRTYDVAANWKLVHENYHECYHCPVIHPELCRVSAPMSGENFAAPAGAWVGGVMDLVPGVATMSFTGESSAESLPGLDARQRRIVLYVGLGWNLLISAHPDYVLTHRITPVAPGRSAVECEWLFPPWVVARPGFDPSFAVDFWDLTNRQDWAAIESVQRGLASPAFVPGRFSPDESAVHQFIGHIAERYQTGCDT